MNYLLQIRRNDETPWGIIGSEMTQKQSQEQADLFITKHGFQARAIPSHGTVLVGYSEFQDCYIFEVQPTEEYQEENRATHFECIINGFDNLKDAITEAYFFAAHHNMEVKVTK